MKKVEKFVDDRHCFFLTRCQPAFSIKIFQFSFQFEDAVDHPDNAAGKDLVLFFFREGLEARDCLDDVREIPPRVSIAVRYDRISFFLLCKGLIGNICIADDDKAFGIPEQLTEYIRRSGLVKPEHNDLRSIQER